MKVKELIVLLQKHDPEAVVETEGCDCFGIPVAVVTSAEFYSKGEYAEFYKECKDVIITREDVHP